MGARTKGSELVFQAEVQSGELGESDFLPDDPNRSAEVDKLDEEKIVYPPKSDAISIKESLFDIQSKVSVGNDHYKISMDKCVRFLQQHYNIPEFMAKGFLTYLRMGTYINIVKEDVHWFVIIGKKR